jgi:hypothetical protein
MIDGKSGSENMTEKEKQCKFVNKWHRCGMKSGSGSMTVVPFDKVDQGGSNGINLTVAVALLAEISSMEQKVAMVYMAVKKKVYEWDQCGMKSGSGPMAVVPIDR